MSTQTPQLTYDNERQKRLAEYLRKEAQEASSDLYIKAKFITDDVDMSPRQIGQLMRRIKDSVPGITIEKWSYTSATTWRVTEDN